MLKGMLTSNRTIMELKLIIGANGLINYPFFQSHHHGIEIR